MTSTVDSAQVQPSAKPNRQVWYRPTVSLEHGVYVMLLVSFLTGAAAAQAWNWMTTLALVCAYCGFQAEHPWILQIKQRRSIKPRFVVWGSLYGGVAATIAFYLYWVQGTTNVPLLSIYGGAIAAFVIDAIAVFYREQKSIPNEFIAFAAVCLSAPLAYVVTTGTFTPTIIGLWLLNTLFFSSTIFTVKFRKDKAHAIAPSVIYHAITTLVIAGLWWMGWLTPWSALAFGVVLLKFLVILWQRQWYCTTKIQFVAMLETGTASVFLILATLSLLPAHL